MKKSITILSGGLLLCLLQSACTPLVITGAVAGAGASIAAERRNPERIFEDQAVEVRATDYIYADQEFGKKVHISVTSFNGNVLLTGEAPKIEYKDTIVERIKSMRSVKKVIDTIEIKPVISMADRTNDVWVTSKVKSNIIANKGLISRTKVVTSDNKVYLMGLVSNDEAEQVLKIVNKINGIDKVVPLFESLDGSLDTKLTAASYATEKLTPPAKQQLTKQMISDEDDITVQPYVLQPPILLSNDQ